MRATDPALTRSMKSAAHICPSFSMPLFGAIKHTAHMGLPKMFWKGRSYPSVLEISFLARCCAIAQELDGLDERSEG